jgi:hypothetical protein
LLISVIAKVGTRKHTLVDIPKTPLSLQDEIYPKSKLKLDAKIQNFIDFKRKKMANSNLVVGKEK